MELLNCVLTGWTEGEIVQYSIIMWFWRKPRFHQKDMNYQFVP